MVARSMWGISKAAWFGRHGRKGAALDNRPHKDAGKRFRDAQSVPSMALVGAPAMTRQQRRTGRPLGRPIRSEDGGDSLRQINVPEPSHPSY
jgi:hypothetical protein